MKKLIRKKAKTPEINLVMLCSFEKNKDKVWHCDRCLVIFEPTDNIALLNKDFLCPLKNTGVFKNKLCLNSLSYADMEYWNEKFTLVNL